ncbi:MAG: hypothetical protein Q7S11_01755 [bacterium]|nr:hypothetical protein [bacterium]
MNPGDVKKFIVAGGALVVLVLVSCGLTGCKTPWSKDGNQSDSSTSNTNTTEIPGLVPDPGEAGKATIPGIITNSKGIRDDIYNYILINHQDSEKTREALFQEARVLQNALLDANDKVKSINHGDEITRAGDCLRYISPQDASKVENSFVSMFINTDARHKAFEAFDRQIGGQSFAGTPYDQRKTACTFTPDSLPN